MSYKKLQEDLRYWGCQLGNYNDGCGCYMCLTAIKEGFNKVIDEAIKLRKIEYDNEVQKLNEK